MSLIESTTHNGAMTVDTDPIMIAQHIGKLMAVGETLLESGMLPKSIRTPQAAVAIMLAGRELGVPPMQAFTSINVIEGKPTVSPQLMMGLAERTGLVEYCNIEDDGQACTVTLLRSGGQPFTASFSMQDAIDMKLSGKYNWKSMPKVMRQWRAISAAYRVVFADVLAGVYTPEEMGATVDGEGAILVDAEVAPVQIAAEPEKVAENEPQAPPVEKLEDRPDPDPPIEPEVAPEASPWINTPEGLPYHERFTKAKAFIGEVKYEAIMAMHSLKNRLDLVSALEADEVLDVMIVEARRIAKLEKEEAAKPKEIEPLPPGLPTMDGDPMPWDHDNDDAAAVDGQPD
jgi:hypothetical protein